MNKEKQSDIKEQAEILKKKYLYRKYILTGKIKITLSVARKMIGQDCAYHLYGKTKKDSLPNTKESVTEKNNTQNPL